MRKILFLILAALFLAAGSMTAFAANTVSYQTDVSFYDELSNSNIYLIYTGDVFKRNIIVNNLQKIHGTA